MSLIKALVSPVTPFQQNAPILFCEESKKCAFVDPGGDLDILLGAAKDNDLIPEKIFLTHGHADHAGAAMELASMLSIEIEGPHHEDAFLLESLESQGKMFGMHAQNCIPNRWLLDGDEVHLGNEILQVLFCPGHTPGHQPLKLVPENFGRLVLSGDLYHFEISRQLRRTPVFNTDAEETLRSMNRVEVLTQEAGATFWMEHSLELANSLNLAPYYYD